METTSVLNESDLTKSDLSLRLELREKLNHDIGDKETLFSIDSDLLQLMTMTVIKLVELNEKNENEANRLSNYDQSLYQLVKKITQSINDQSLVFPITIKNQNRNEDEIFAVLKDRYTKTSNALIDYYQKLKLNANHD